MTRTIKEFLVRKRRLLLASAGMLCAGAVLATQLLATAAGAATAATPQPFAAYLKAPSTTLAASQVLAIARSEASRAGEVAPTLSVTRGSLEDAMRSIDPSTIIPESAEPAEKAMFATPVSLVIMHGTFTLTSASVPRGVKAPSGSVLELIIDEHTGEVMGRALPTPQQAASQLALSS
jgi:hypothetical protein